MKIKLLRCNLDVLVMCFKKDLNYIYITEKALPDDAEIIDIKPSNHYKVVNLIIKSEEYEDIADGQSIPEIDKQQVFYRVPEYRE